MRLQDSISYRTKIKTSRFCHKQRSYGRQRITLPGKAYLIKKYFNGDLSLLTHGVGGQIAKY